jgi:hypothetical protein
VPDGGPDLQFDRAEFATPVALACGACQRPIGDSYFELNGHVLCPPCRDRVVATHQEGTAPGRLVRAGAAGLAAAVLGAIVWYAVREITKLEIGLIAIAVGIGVGTAVRRGARGRGGMPYQVLAVLLTYLSIASSNAPAIWNGFRHGIENQVAHRLAAAGTAPTATSPDPEAVRARVDAVIAHLPPSVWLWIAWVVLESPFLGGPEHFIGWLITFFGLQQAWRMTRATPFEVTGPFSLAERAASG